MSTQLGLDRLSSLPTPAIPEEDEKRLRALATSVSRSRPDEAAALEFVIRAYQLGGNACHQATARIAEEEPLSMIELEKRAIAKALVHTHGSIVASAKLLGIGKTTLYRKLREFKMREDLLNRYACPVCGAKLDTPIIGQYAAAEQTTTPSISMSPAS